jgi:hypothetical protein
MRILLAPLLLGACVAGGCAAGSVVEETEQSADFDRTPHDCISITRISRTEVIDEQTVLFHMSGREIYRNVLPEECPGLNRRDPFMYEPRSIAPELCENDQIELLQRFGGSYQRGRACRLGKFHPMTQEDLDDLKRTGPSPVQVEPAQPVPAADAAPAEPSAGEP